MVQSHAANVVLELGPGTFQELRRHTNFRTLTAIVISHMHVDHIADLLALQFALAYNPVPPPAPLPLYVPPGGKRTLDKLAAVFASDEESSRFFEPVFQVGEYDPDETLILGDMRLSFSPTKHFIPCWAIRVTGFHESTGDLTYTADTGPAADLATFASRSSVLVAEATYAEPPSTDREQRGHLSAAEAGHLATSADVGTLILTHLWEEVGFETYRAHAAATFSGRIEIARPGLHIEW